MSMRIHRLGLKSVTRMAHESGSAYKVGKKVLIRRSIFVEYLRKYRKNRTMLLTESYDSAMLILEINRKEAFVCLSLLQN
ncbi:MAG: DUF6462 family protein [Clostridiales bacterium]|nr:DUF6462 family protein [Clostridiales bacterium]